jgi:hypothetical protein
VKTPLAHTPPSSVYSIGSHSAPITPLTSTRVAVPRVNKFVLPQPLHHHKHEPIIVQLTLPPATNHHPHRMHGPMVRLPTSATTATPLLHLLVVLNRTKTNKETTPTVAVLAPATTAHATYRHRLLLHDRQQFLQRQHQQRLLVMDQQQLSINQLQTLPYP